MRELELFQNALPLAVKELLTKINSLGFKAGVIGGAPRDFLLQNTISYDIDVELRPQVDLAGDELLAKFKELVTKLSKYYAIKEKGFNIHEIQIEEFNIEFGLPRIELFTDEINHSNFTAKHISDIDYTDGFKRRDFTANAIMFEFDQTWKLVDPLGGVQDLKLRRLKACNNQSFVKDPVRFLRAVRFSIKLKFEMDLVLVTLLENMELSLSPHYLRLEAQKSKMPLSFLLLCLKLRPEFFPLEQIKRHENIVADYEKVFKSSDLKLHISQALFMTAAERTAVLKFFELKAKGLLDVNLKEVNFGKIKNSSLEELSKFSWCTQFINFLDKSAEFDPKKIDWLFDEEGMEVDVSFVQDYSECEVVVPVEIPNKLKKFYILQQRTQKLVH